MKEPKQKKRKTTGTGGVPSAKVGSSPTSEAGEVVKFDEAGMPTLDVWLEDEAATCKEFLQVQIEGRRRISRLQKFYNLDAIISVGYRVNSIRGVRFRQWATSVLKEYLLRGLVRDRRIGKLEKRMTAAERSIGVIIDTLMPALPENREPIGFHT